MTKEELQQKVKDYFDDKVLLDRNDFVDFTQRYEKELGFDCIEVGEEDKYMVARIDATAHPGNEETGKVVSVTFDLEAIPDKLLKFNDTEEFVENLYSLHQEAKIIRNSIIKF